jgi:hypothetical protein
MEVEPAHLANGAPDYGCDGTYLRNPRISRKNTDQTCPPRAESFTATARNLIICVRPYFDVPEGKSPHNFCEELSTPGIETLIEVPSDWRV